MAVPKVKLVTANERKADECCRILGRYGGRIAVVVPEPDLDAQATSLLAAGATHVIRETSDLVASDGGPVDLRLAAAATNVSRLTVWTRNGRLDDVAKVPGFVDPIRAMPTPGKTWFGWDDVFVHADTGLSYREAADLGLKASARDQTLGRFASLNLRFEEGVDLRFGPIAPARPVDFDRDVAGVLASSPLVTGALAQESDGTFARLLGSVLDGGLFYRSATSRRERVYWLPGLNGGIPLTPKKDSVHESTFQMHDVMHWASPDLVFDGTSTPDARVAIRPPPHDR